MATKKLQKVFYFSSEDKKNYIETRLENLSKINNYSTSYIIENLILEGLLPENEEAKSLLLYKLKGDHGVQNTLEALFSDNAAGVLDGAKHPNLKPIIQYAMNHCSIDIFNDEENHVTNYFLIQFEEVVKRINKFTEYCIDVDEKNYYKPFANNAQHMLKDAKEIGSSVDIFNHLCLVRDCWEILGNWSTTFRYLAELVRINNLGWDESFYAREELHKLISELSKNWIDTPDDKIEFTALDRIVPAFVKFECKKNEDHYNGMNIYVNSVPVGVVYSVFAKKEDLVWDIFEDKQAVRFSFRKKEIFLAVLENLKKLKEEAGYKRLIITSYNGGIASFFTDETLVRCGFEKSEEYGSSLYFLR